METVLTLSVGGFPPLCARGCTQEFSIVSVNAFARTVNGTLVTLGKAPSKYKTVITCSDQEVLATGGLVRGQCVEVACLQKLSHVVAGSEIELDRDPVAGSIVFKGQVMTARGRCVTFEKHEEGFIFYRPRLTMRVVGFWCETKEWEAASSWRLEMEEV